MKINKILIIITTVIISISVSAIFIYTKKDIQNNKKDIAEKTLEELAPNLIKNGDFDKESISSKFVNIFSKSNNNLPPYGWKIYSEKLKNPQNKIRFQINYDTEYTYIADTSLLVEAETQNLGITQEIPQNIILPGLIEAQVMLLSGKVKLTVTDKNNNEIGSSETVLSEQAKNTNSNWQRLYVRLPENSNPKKLIIIATQDNSKFYITNINVKGKNDLSEYYEDFKGEYTLKELTKDCQNINDGQEYLECVKETTGLTEKELRNYKGPVLKYKDEIINYENNSNQSAGKNVLGARNTFQIKKIYIDAGIKDSVVDAMLNEIEHVWEDEAVNQDVTVEGAEKIYFDPTNISNCVFENNPEKDVTSITNKYKFYTPDSYCYSHNSILLSEKGWPSAYLTSKRMILTTQFFTDYPVFITKHEFGHIFGALDHDDFSDIKGNFIYPEGSTKYGTNYQDIMWGKPRYYNAAIVTQAKQISKFMINLNDNYNYHNKYYLNKVNKIKLIFPEEKTDYTGKYELYYARNLGNHLNAVVNNTYDKKDILTETITLDEFNYPIIGAYLLVYTDQGKIFKGKFDLRLAS